MSQANPFGVARDFRKAHGEAAFQALVSTAFAESDVDKSGTIDKSELRNTLKKLNIHMVGVTASVMQKYDADSSGEISEDEFSQLVSDLIDGTFEKEAATMAAAKEKEKEKAAAAEAEAALRKEVATLRSELTAQKKLNEAMKANMAALEKKVERLANVQADHDDKLRRMDKRAYESAAMSAMEQSIGMKAGVDGEAMLGATANEAAFKAAGLGGAMNSMDAAKDLLGVGSKHAAQEMMAGFGGGAKKPPQKQPSAKKKGMFGL
jgi:hypothetical protein